MPFYPVEAATYWDGSAYRPVEYLGDPTPPTLAPTTPTGLDFTASTTSIVVTWEPSTPGAGDGIDHYNVRRNGVQLPATVPTATFTDTGRAAGTTYLYQVQAVSDQGLVSGWSATLTARTLDPPGSTGVSWGITAVQQGDASKGAAYDRITAVTGVPRNFRYYYSGAEFTWPLSGIGNRLNGMDLLVASSKFSTASINNGSRDAALRAAFASVNQPLIYCCGVHEVDVKLAKGEADCTPDEYKASVRRVAGLIREVGNPMVSSCQIQGYHQFKTRWPDVMVEPGDVDFFGFDPYAYWLYGPNRSIRTFAEGYAQMVEVFDWIKARWGLSDGRRIFIAELGVSPGSGSASPNTDAQCAAGLDGQLTACEDYDIFAVQYFFNNNNQFYPTSYQGLPARPLTQSVWLAHSGLSLP